MFEKGAKNPAIEIGAHSRLLDERARGTADGLRISDRVQPRSSRQHGACSTQLREKATTTRWNHGGHLSADRWALERELHADLQLTHRRACGVDSAIRRARHIHIGVAPDRLIERV